MIKAAAVADSRNRHEDHRFDPRKHRGVHADADAERQDDNGREARHAGDRAEGVADHVQENSPSLSPKAFKSSWPIACIRLSITFESGVPFFALRCVPPLSAPPAWPASRNGTRL